MTVLDIANYATRRLVGKSISIDDAIDWINDALDEMGIDARRFATTQLSAQKDTWYDLPANCLKVADVTDSNGKPYYLWTTDGTRISFRDTDTYTLRYYRPPNKVATQSDTPDCPEAFHQALAYYVAYRFDARDFPGSDMAAARLNEYYRRITAARDNLQRRDRYVKVWKWS